MTKLKTKKNQALRLDRLSTHIKKRTKHNHLVGDLVIRVWDQGVCSSLWSQVQTLWLLIRWTL
jgi:hypothetical protein